MSVEQVSSNVYGQLDAQIAQLIQCKPLPEQEVFFRLCHPICFSLLCVCSSVLFYEALGFEFIGSPESALTIYHLLRGRHEASSPMVFQPGSIAGLRCRVFVFVAVFAPPHRHPGRNLSITAKCSGVLLSWPHESVLLREMGWPEADEFSILVYFRVSSF
jgi:hypothetical protein